MKLRWSLYPQVLKGIVLIVRMHCAHCKDVHTSSYFICNSSESDLQGKRKAFFAVCSLVVSFLFRYEVAFHVTVHCSLTGENVWSCYPINRLVLVVFSQLSTGVVGSGHCWSGIRSCCYYVRHRFMMLLR